MASTSVLMGPLYEKSLLSGKKQNQKKSGFIGIQACLEAFAYKHSALCVPHPTFVLQVKGFVPHISYSFKTG